VIYVTVQKKGREGLAGRNSEHVQRLSRAVVLPRSFCHHGLEPGSDWGILVVD